ncbi:MAG: tRNA (adenosine(37)-N6)-threonylcarbamoyltransferase complex ATPase subunit type 1 TsaE [Dehalococcoidia bacterium]|nr:tRNA (adenosine(37)-N6)-threonylcarbamoyltransferase complex ATPase subunit type 1 TsaE [Dehalococcoidia bacterium]
MDFEITTESPEETGSLGELIGSLVEPGDVLLLVGSLGSGKTRLTQGIGEGMGIDDSIASPTFVIVMEHRGTLPLYHVDLYRLEETAAVLDLGLDDYFYGDGVTVVEWADRAMPAMPPEHLLVRMSYIDEDHREMVFHPEGERYLELTRDIATARYKKTDV